MAALLEASRHGKIDALQLLDADIHVRDRELRTALHFAAQGAHEDSARLLLLQRAEVDPVCARGLTPLALAARGGAVRLCWWLADLRADLHARDRAGDTPMHHAADTGRPAVVRFLLHRHADPFERNARGETPLDIARFRQDIETTKTLASQREVWVSMTRSEKPPQIRDRKDRTQGVRIICSVPAAPAQVIAAAGEALRDNVNRFKSEALRFDFEARDWVPLEEEVGPRRDLLLLRARDRYEPLFSEQLGRVPHTVARFMGERVVSQSYPKLGQPDEVSFFNAIHRLEGARVVPADDCSIGEGPALLDDADVAAAEKFDGFRLWSPTDVWELASGKVLRVGGRGQNSSSAQARFEAWSAQAAEILRPRWLGGAPRRARFLLGFRPDSWGPAKDALEFQPASLAEEEEGDLFILAVRVLCPAATVRTYPVAHTTPWPEYRGLALERGWDSHLVHVEVSPEDNLRGRETKTAKYADSKPTEDCRILVESRDQILHIAKLAEARVPSTL